MCVFCVCLYLCVCVCGMGGGILRRIKEIKEKVGGHF